MSGELKLETNFISSGADVLCWLEIWADEKCLTANIKDGQQRDGILVSPLPLARWFGNAFWRLTSEAGPSWRQTPDLSWHMAHQMQACGEGYVWPNLTIFSNDRQLTVLAGSQDEWQARMQPCIFTEEAACQLSVEPVRRELLKFMEESFQQTGDQELECRHGQILRELDEAEYRQYRELEAMLGYDPDYAPEDMMDELAESDLDYPTLAEISNGLNPLCGVRFEEQPEKFSAITNDDNGMAVRFDLTRRELSRNEDPWTSGRKLAKGLRKELGLDPESRIHVQTLLDCMRLTKEQFEDLPMAQDACLCAMDDNCASIKILRGRTRRIHNSRFQAARCIGAWLSAPREARWLTLTKSMSWEQQCQRNFAADFLAPMHAVLNMLKEMGSIGASSVIKVADYFMVSPMTICHSLVNHKRISKKIATHLMRQIECHEFDKTDNGYSPSPSPC